MHVLDAGEILELTERGTGAGPAQRALLVLEAAFPDVLAPTIAATPLSQRDRALLAVRASLFGPELHAQDTCDHCGEALELTLTADAIGLGPSPDPFPPATQGRLASGDQVRAVTAADASAVERAGDPATARALLATRVAPGADDAQDLDDALEALDPAADVELVLRCPECGRTTVRTFDAPTFVWSELEACAPRILVDVADLARSFHWSERDILSMSANRRAFYLSEARS